MIKMFFYYTMMIAMINTTKVELETDTIDVRHIDNGQQQPAFDRKNIEQFKKIHIPIHQNNKKLKELYYEIVKVFNKYHSQNIIIKNETTVFEFLISKDKSTELMKESCEDEQTNDVKYTYYVKNFCEDRKNELLKKAIYRDLEIDFAFSCALNMFVETMAFSINTLNKIYKLRLENEDDEEFRKKLFIDEKFYEKYVLSLNFLYKIGRKKINLILLHNFDSVKVNNFDKNYYKLSISYNFYNKVELDKFENKIFEKINNNLSIYYKKNKINTMHDILEYENTKKYTEYLKSVGIVYNVEGEDKLESLAIIAFNAMVMFRSADTKLNLIPKTGYYEDSYKLIKEYESSEQQKVLEKYLQKRGANFGRKLLNFDVLSMHQIENIMDICTLSVSLENNIEKLMNFADQYINALIDRNKDKHGIAITEFFEHLIDNKENEQVLDDIKSAQKICTTEFKAIIGLPKEIKDMELAQKLEKYKETDFQEQYENEYKIIIQEVVNIKLITNYAKQHVHNINAKTRPIISMCKNRKPFFETILLIINTNQKIKNGKENLVYDELQIYKKSEKRSYVSNFINDIKKMLTAKEPNPHKNEIERTETTINLEKSACFTGEAKCPASCIDTNKSEIIELVNNSILLKGLIFDAEYYASEIIDSLLKNDNF